MVFVLIAKSSLGAAFERRRCVDESSCRPKLNQIAMKTLHWLIAGTAILGALCGPSALDAGAAAQPPITWPDIPFVFFGSVLGILFVIGIQLFRRDPKPSLRPLYFFGVAGLWFVASGLSAVVLSIVRGSVAPFAFVIIAAGAGVLLGVWACRLIFRQRFKNA